MVRPGTVFLVGAGPGDPGLITERGNRILEGADLVLYDALVHPELLERCRPGARIEYVGKRAGRESERQARINERMVEAASNGLVVVRLKGGDPYLFGRGSEEVEALSAAGIAFEVVPGVPSPLAATAYAGISLTHRKLASSVAYVTATESPEKDRTSHDWTRLATATQTLVIFMGLRKIESLMALLVEHGRSAETPAAVIESASLASQRVAIGTVGTIAEISERDGLHMPALIVVGDVVTLRDRLRWFDRKPLFGRRVLVTRSAEDGHAMGRLLRDAGAEPVFLPTIEVLAPEDPEPLRVALGKLSTYAWVVFTSRNGVDRVFAELDRQGLDARAFGGARIAAIGPATAARLAARGLRADVVPDEFVGEAVAMALQTAHGGTLAGTKILLPRAAVARNALPDALTAAGASVEVVTAYRTAAPQGRDDGALRQVVEGVDVVTFTAPSTVRNLLSLLGRGGPGLLRGKELAAIGPITAAAVREEGLSPTVVATQYTAEGLVEALARSRESG
ncbi:MAG: uroporphyrinogen-III C-methyltransferase [Myxococcales bacterium]|nr:uroporphyrinogen-III C-methyltransferase [Myxococcales bacterium]